MYHVPGEDAVAIASSWGAFATELRLLERAGEPTATTLEITLEDTDGRRWTIREPLTATVGTRAFAEYGESAPIRNVASVSLASDAVDPVRLELGPLELTR